MHARKSHRRSARPRSKTALDRHTSLRPALDTNQVGLLLTGASVALLFAGFGERMYLLLGYTPRAYAVSVPLLAAALSAGIWIANRFWGRRDETARHSTDPRADDRRAVTSSLANLSAALVIFFLPNWISVAEYAHDLLFEAFFWSRESVIAFDAIIAVIAVLPVVIVGALLADRNRAASRLCGMDRTAMMVAAGGAALMLLGVFGSVDLVVRAGIRLAVAPLLVSSIWWVAWRRNSVAPSRRTPNVDVIREPELRNRWPTLLRLTVGIAVLCAACAGAMWVHVAMVMQAGSFRVTLAAAGMAVVGVAIGLRKAAREEDPGRRIVESGAACALSGGVTAVALILFGVVNAVADSPFRQSIGFAGLYLTCLLPVTVLMGRAIGLTEMSVVRRADPERSINHFNHVLLICGSIGMSLIAWLSIRYLGSFTSLTAIALTLLTAGGVLMIHDPSGDVDGRRRRVAMTFAAILAMTVTLPQVQNGWLRNRQYRRAGLVETWWTARATGPDGAENLYTSQSRSRLLSRDAILEALAVHNDGLLSTAVMGAIDADNDFSDRNRSRSTFTAIRRLDWMDQLRHGRDRHASMVITLSGLPNDLVKRICSAGALDVALARLTSAGRLTIITRDGNERGEMWRTIADRLERYGANYIRGFALDSTGQLALEFVTRDLGRQFGAHLRPEAKLAATAQVKPRVVAASP